MPDDGYCRGALKRKMACLQGIVCLEDVCCLIYHLSTLDPQFAWFTHSCTKYNTMEVIVHLIKHVLIDIGVPKEGDTVILQYFREIVGQILATQHNELAFIAMLSGATPVLINPKGAWLRSNMQILISDDFFSRRVVR